MTTNYCGNCGAVANAAARFCRQCGLALAEPEEPAFPVQSEPTAETDLKAGGVGTSGPVVLIAVPEGGAPYPLAVSSHGHLSAARQALPPEPKLIGRGETSNVVPISRSLRKVRDQLDKLGVKRGSSGGGAMPNSAGAARALARASGITTPSRFGAALRPILIALAILLGSSAYLAYRDQSPSTLHAGRPHLNLIAPDEKSSQFIKAGEDERERGHYEAAIEAFKQAVELTPNHTAALLSLANLYKVVGNTGEAIQTYLRLLKVNEGYTEARLQLANVYRDRGDWREALQEYQRVIATDPNSEQALAALHVLETFTAERPALGPLRSRRSATNTTLGRWLPDGDNGSHVNLTLPELAFSTLGHQPAFGVNTSVADYLGAHALAEVHKEKGKRFNNAGQYQAAIKEFQTAMNLTPDDKDLYYLMGLAFKSNGQPALAYEYYKKCDSGTYARVAPGAAKIAEKEARDEAKKRRPKKPVSQLSPDEMMRSFK